MATCLNYNCEALGDHEVATLTCKGPRPSGISEVVLILCGNDLTDPPDRDWETSCHESNRFLSYS